MAIKGGVQQDETLPFCDLVELVSSFVTGDWLNASGDS